MCREMFPNRMYNMHNIRKIHSMHSGNIPHHSSFRSVHTDTLLRGTITISMVRLLRIRNMSFHRDICCPLIKRHRKTCQSPAVFRCCPRKAGSPCNHMACRYNTPNHKEYPHRAFPVIFIFTTHRHKTIGRCFGRSDGVRWESRSRFLCTINPHSNPLPEGEGTYRCS